MESPIITALLSYGMSGKVFHAPFLSQHTGFTLYKVLERNQQLAKLDYPNIQSISNFKELINDPQIELMVVNTPTATHFDLAKQCLEAGKHVIVEKAFTLSSVEGETLKSLAEKKGCLLSVFHNRRWDSDFKTVSAIVKSGQLGEIVEAEFHFDRFKASLSPKLHKENPIPGAGILYDLGPHIIDQALCLFGMPMNLFADLRITRPGSLVVDYFELLLYYPNLRVRLKAGYLVKESIPAYVLHGRNGSFLKSRADVQEAHLISKQKPKNTQWGIEPANEQGILNTLTHRVKVPSLQGNYLTYFENIYQAIRHHQALSVTATDGINTIKLIEAAMESNEKQKIINVS